MQVDEQRRPEPVAVMRYIVSSYEAALQTLMDLYQAHDKQHPDKDECGGVGRCLMMRTEVEAEQGLERMLRQMASEDIRLQVSAKCEGR